MITSFEAYNGAQFVVPFRFNHPPGGCMSRGESCDIQSGLDTQGTNAALTLRTSGHSGDNRSCYVLAECTSQLMIGAGQAVSVRS